MQDPLEQEQALFEQRLLEHADSNAASFCGIAIRKINQHGKSNLRYVRCVTVDAAFASTRSVGKGSAWGVRRPSSDACSLPPSSAATTYRALAWGKKKDVQIALRLFTAVVKGKTTERARRSPAPVSRILSLLTRDPHHPSLDIEAPTTLDRDKFARAFARFLAVPLYESGRAVAAMAVMDDAPEGSSTPSSLRDSESTSPGEMEVFTVPFLSPTGGDWAPTAGERDAPPAFTTHPLATSEPPEPASIADTHHEETVPSSSDALPHPDHDNQEERILANTAIVSLAPGFEEQQAEERSHVSSLTGHGYDQELVEELHNALNELRAELEESRAEAARAVKVAEQAIQSAEKNNSLEWQNTVTHKAAEAAALAQKRSAAAMAKQRIAEERLEGERRAAAFWRTQAEIAEEQAGVLQTRAAAAEVQRAALAEQLLCDRQRAQEEMNRLRGRYTSTDAAQRDALDAAGERSRVLELELDATRRDLQAQRDELAELLLIVDEQPDGSGNKHRKVKRNFGRGKGKKSDGPDATSLLADSTVSSSSAALPLSVDAAEQYALSTTPEGGGLTTEQVLKIHAETQLMRQQFEMLKRATADHLEQLPDNIKLWGQQIAHSLHSAQAEVVRLQASLAMERASRRKLLHEVQDLRGAVRVYCRPRPPRTPHQCLSFPSHESMVLHCDEYDETLGPVSLEFDRVFEPQATQQDVFIEVEEVLLGVLDGYNICLLAYGPADCGKTRTLLGDMDLSTPEKMTIQNYGIHLQAMDELFSIAQYRRERYKDTFTLTIIEVHNDRIRDLVAATETGGSRGHVMVAETKNGGLVKRSKGLGDDDASSGLPSKLEIRTDIHGDTVVQGLVAVEVQSMEDVMRLWEECLAVKARRLEEQGLDAKQYDAANHVMATLRVKSCNIATGVGTIGKIQFVDLAAADIVPRSVSPIPSGGETEEPAAAFSSLAHQTDWRFVNRSLETFSECIEARMQYDRSVPYRNSTLTHLLRDSFEADTKVLLLACVSSEPEHMMETAAVLKFASRIRRVIIGKATKHILSSS
jgi:kinesin family member C2/C3